MNPLSFARLPRASGSLVSVLRSRPLAPPRQSLLPRRPTTTYSRLNSPFTMPLNGIVVPGPPPPALYERATHAFSPLVRAFHAYGKAHNKRPYTTQLLTSVVIYLLGDLNAQLLFPEKDKQYDPVRTLRMITIGSILSAPSYRWFLFLSNLFSPKIPKAIAVGLRVLINQLCFTPVFLTTYFSLQSIFTGDSAEETARKLQETLPTAYKNSCQLWPAVTAINFWLIKLEYRSIVSGVVSIGWNAYLSYLNQKAGAEEELGLEDAVPVPVLQEQLKQRRCTISDEKGFDFGVMLKGVKGALTGVLGRLEEGASRLQGGFITV